jgi:hypothetical protein
MRATGKDLFIISLCTIAMVIIVLFLVVAAGNTAQPPINLQTIPLLFSPSITGTRR